MISATQGAAPSAASANDNVDALHALILHQLEEDQAQETISIPLAGKSSIADHMVIASGRSTRHVSAIAEKLAQRIKQEAGRQVR
ncbi:MAG: RsfS/YbeB/iojap family protein, partial [Alphaproteobacteria bacterium]|nr:RsfS/YbeB/iojap family protein [Alphaproteobacteria bacterium]